MAISIAPVSARTSVPFTQRRAGDPERPHGRSLTALRVQDYRAMPSRLGEDGLLELPSAEDLAGALPLGSSVPSSRFLRGCRVHGSGTRGSVSGTGLLSDDPHHPDGQVTIAGLW
jgi:hypothetical protein